MSEYKGKKICIVCEGYEEKDYMDAIINKKVFSNKYEIIPINAKSINNVIARYEEKYQSDSYSLVLIFCDTDKKPYEKYKEVKRKVNEFHGNDVADEVVIFGNPCTMQIILSHFAEIKLESNSKSINSKYIKEYVGIEGYDARNDQRKELFSKIKRDNYETMKENVAKLKEDDNIVASTNILKFFENFESDNESWIDEINNKLES